MTEDIETGLYMVELFTRRFTELPTSHLRESIQPFHGRNRKKLTHCSIGVPVVIVEICF